MVDIADITSIRAAVSSLKLQHSIGSTLFIESAVFLQLCMLMPCLHCGRTTFDTSKSKPELSSENLIFEITKLCAYCSHGRSKVRNYETVLNNRPRFQEAQFAAVLISGQTFTVVERYMMMIGMSNFISESTFYHQKKNQLQSKLSMEASNITTKALKDVISETKRRGISVLFCSFDTGWAHCKNSSEAASFLMSGITPPGYKEVPIIAVGVAFRSRLSKKRNGDGTISPIILRQGNTEESSRAFEHFTLDSIVTDPQLKEILDGMQLEITIDGDLNSLKYLMLLDIINKVTYIR